MRCRRPLIFRATSSLAAAAAAIAAAAAVAACGSNRADSSSASSSAGRHTYAQTMQDDVRFGRCMRSHGVPNFPHLTSPYEFKRWLISSAAQSPANQSAETDCQHLLPGGSGPRQNEPRTQAQIAAMLAFARCLRSHGFPNFPDPTSSGHLSPEMVTAAGINLHQPGLLRAGVACVPVTHGLLTPAAIEQAVNGG
jgi:hypothetical protein